jgi:hypothetical protein
MGRGDREWRPTVLPVSRPLAFSIDQFDHCFLKSAIACSRVAEYPFTRRYRPEPRLVFRCLRVKHDATDYFAVTISHIVIVSDQ